MKTIIIFLGLIFVLVFQSCRKKRVDFEPNTKFIELSQEMLSYFADFKVGTKWIYQDTLDLNYFDTIELISKQKFNRSDGGGTLYVGFVLYYEPIKAKPFKVYVSPGINNSCFVKVDPLVDVFGKIVYENHDGVWMPQNTYFDSIEITGSKYYSVIHSNSSNNHMQYMSISKNLGICSFWKTKGGGVLLNFNKLIKVIKA
jgi:hypothetical protein